MATRHDAGPSTDFLQHLVEGLVRVAIFLGYLWLIVASPDIRRVFQYHGAEHMTIHALEAGDPLNVNAVRQYPTAHQRCGTEFLVVVIILSILAFSLIGRQEPLIMIVSRILLIPVIAAVGYEILRFGARHRGNPIIKALFLPGIRVQAITTKQPTDDMIEVAIVSMEEALRADGETLPAAGRVGGTRCRSGRRRGVRPCPPRRSPDRAAGHDRRRPAGREASTQSSSTSRNSTTPSTRTSRSPRSPATRTRSAGSARSSRSSSPSSPHTGG